MRVGAAIGLEGGVEDVLEGVFEEIVADVLAGTLVVNVGTGRDCNGVAGSVEGRVSVSSIT